MTASTASRWPAPKLGEAKQLLRSSWSMSMVVTPTVAVWQTRRTTLPHSGRSVTRSSGAVDNRRMSGHGITPARGRARPPPAPSDAVVVQPQAATTPTTLTAATARYVSRTASTTAGTCAPACSDARIWWAESVAANTIPATAAPRPSRSGGSAGWSTSAGPRGPPLCRPAPPQTVPGWRCPSPARRARRRSRHRARRRERHHHGGAELSSPSRAGSGLGDSESTRAAPIEPAVQPSVHRSSATPTSRPRQRVAGSRCRGEARPAAAAAGTSRPPGTRRRRRTRPRWPRSSWRSA